MRPPCIQSGKLCSDHQTLRGGLDARFPFSGCVALFTPTAWQVRSPAAPWGAPKPLSTKYPPQLPHISGPINSARFGGVVLGAIAQHPPRLCLANAQRAKGQYLEKVTYKTSMTPNAVTMVRNGVVRVMRLQVCMRDRCTRRWPLHPHVAFAGGACAGADVRLPCDLCEALPGAAAKPHGRGSRARLYGLAG